MIKEIDFLGKRRLAAIFSGVLLLTAIVSFAAQGLKLGIDFTGGTLVEIGYQKSVDLKTMRAALEDAGFDDATIQHFGSTQEVLIRLQPKDGLSNAQLSTEVATAASEAPEEIPPKSPSSLAALRAYS